MPRPIDEQLVTESSRTTPIGHTAPAKMFAVQRVVLTAGEQRTVFFDRIPEYVFILAPLETSGLVCWMWPGFSLPDERLPVYGGGHTKVPALGQGVTVLNELATSLDLRVIGLAQLDEDSEIVS